MSQAQLDSAHTWDFMLNRASEIASANRGPGIVVSAAVRLLLWRLRLRVALVANVSARRS